MENKLDSGLYLYIKRGLDVLLSGFALLLLWPVLLIIALLVRRDGGPAFFTQTRIGRQGKPFAVYKFRSMKPGADNLENFLTPEQLAQYKREFKLDPDPRITKIGQFLRKSSLDELPQLWNIFRGDMSIVGPRPLLQPELQKNYTPEEQYRLLSVRPGLTGYWQASSRNETTYATGARQQQELYYIGRVSLWMDIKIVFMTVKRVFSGKGAV
ncbi:MAG: sugar transferase [Clostridia bacterium]|nr:sugar transferase [Clostridia bacterium]